MKLNMVGQLAAEPSRSLLVGTYQGYELRTFTSGFAVEQFSLLVGKRVIDVAVPVQKGVDVKTLKPAPGPSAARPSPVMSASRPANMACKPAPNPSPCWNS